MVSAICPHCNVLLVEADSTALADLDAAVDTAAGWPGVVAVSNSYGGSELDPAADPSIAADYNHPGVAITASSGDAGSNGSCPSDTTTTIGAAGTVTARDHGPTDPAGHGHGHGGGGTTTAPNTYLCQARAGYDGPTGLGTPNGIGAF